MKRYLFIAGWAAMAFASCTPETPEATAVAFSLSDTMMARCRFDTAVMAQVRSELRLFGRISADNSKLAQVYPVVGGSVTSIQVELGDYVKQGQVLAVIRSTEVAELQRQRLDAQGDLAVAEKNLQVARDLYSSRLNSEKDVAEATNAVARAKAELARVDEVYGIYNLREGSQYNITAPISGYIISKRINRNEQLRADMTDPIFSIADIDEVWALANVNEGDIAKVRAGQPATVSTISFPNDAFKGKVDKIFNAIDPETHAMRVLVRIPNADHRLKPDMNATVTLRFDEGREMTAIPASAVVFDKSRNWAMVFHSKNNIETRRIEVYRQLNDTAYIANGLKPGETVIAKGGLFIYDALND